MDYKQLYGRLINFCVSQNGRPINLHDRLDGYENHHICTVNTGGSNKISNLVRMTYRQHYLAHLLLRRMTGTKNPIPVRNSHHYEEYRKRVIAALREEARQGNGSTEPFRSEANRQRSETLKAKRYTCPHCNKTGGGGMLTHHFDFCPKNPNRKEPEILVCEYCGKSGKLPGFKRWHGGNCKKKGA